MNESCRFEANVIEAASSGDWSEALRRHVESCADCEAAAAVGTWMTRFAKIRDREHLLPDPTVLWLKAQLLRSNESVQRVTKPINQAQLFAYAIIAAAWAGLVTFRWDAIRSWLTAVTPGGMMQASATSAVTSSFLMTVLVLGSLTIAFAVHAILAEE